MPLERWTKRTKSRDPFDRVLVAQALIERLPIVTTEAHFGEYGVKVRW